MQKHKHWFWILAAVILTAVFIAFTLVVKFVAVQTVGTQRIGLAAVNRWWRDVIGVNIAWHVVSDVCAGVALLAVAVTLVWQVIQFCRGKNWRGFGKCWWAFNIALLLLGLSYFFFQIVVVNYRPVMLNGVQEAAYPSSHVLLLAAVSLLLVSVVKHEIKAKSWRILITVFSLLVLCVGLVARVLSGYHWLTDSIGGILLGVAIWAWYQVFNAFMTC